MKIRNSKAGLKPLYPMVMDFMLSKACLASRFNISALLAALLLMLSAIGCGDAENVSQYDKKLDSTARDLSIPTAFRDLPSKPEITVSSGLLSS